MAFHEECLDTAKGIGRAILGHPFLKETAECRIPDPVFANWLQRDYLSLRRWRGGRRRVWR